jgi:hypothetical protein
MHPINAKHTFRPTLSLLISTILYCSTTISLAEWVQADITGAKKNIWINTETNRLYVGNSCTPLMKLKHLRGTKPRPLKQRQQAYMKQLISHSNTVKNDRKKPAMTPELRVDRRPVKLSNIQPDPLDLTYKTQPIFDPLNRNNFNIVIDDHEIVLLSQHATIRAKVLARYEHRFQCE